MTQRDAAKTPQRTILEIRLPQYGAVDGGGRREAFREAIARLGIEGKVTIKPSADVIDPDSFGTTSGSITLQVDDSEESKKLWESPSGLVALQIIASILIMFFQEYCEDVRGASSEKLMRGIKEDVEKLLQAYKDQPQPTPKSTPEKRQHRAHRTGSLKGRTSAKRRKE